VNAYGLIGKSLEHSFSKSYFEKKFNALNLAYTYSNFEIDTAEQFQDILQQNDNLKGLNVTIPFKESIMPLLDQLSEEVVEIGAVNCVKIKNGRTIGYNTDSYGFSQSIKPFLDRNHERALILGTGGAAKAVAHALKKLGLEIYFVSSSEKKNNTTFAYSEINDLVMNAFKLIVNTTPLGMFPLETDHPQLPYEYFTADHLAYDLIYNPEKTQFLKKAQSNGAVIMNGISMLQLQAEKSWEIWNDANF
jgi:shikimate dehydrogenase